MSVSYVLGALVEQYNLFVSGRCWLQDSRFLSLSLESCLASAILLRGPVTPARRRLYIPLSISLSDTPTNSTPVFALFRLHRPRV